MTIQRNHILLMIFSLSLFIGTVAPRTCQAVTKKAFDFVVGVNGDFKAAMSAASSAASSGKRFYIFFPKGEYAIGSLTGDGNQKTTISTSNLSFIGENIDSTIISNKATSEGISITATLYFNKANNLYLQDLTVLNKGNYYDAGAANVTGRYVAIQDQGDKNIYKNIKLLSKQDTYYSLSSRTYWEDCEIHGFVDFICGYGDVFFNKCLLYLEQRSTVVITAPSTKTSWGYVFMDCTIDGAAGDGYRLGRPWSNQPKCVYLNTIMKKVPQASGWGDPMNVVPAVFAEYNSKTASGSSVNLSSRRTTYTMNGTTVTLNPVLSASEAAKYTIKNVVGGSDNWQPDNAAQQIGAPVIALAGSTLSWTNNDSALCWIVFKNGKFYKCVTEPECTIASADATGAYFVRAANAMGGLGAPSNHIDASITNFTLTTSVAGGEGTITPSSGSFADGQSVTVTATPTEGWMFDHWSGDLSGNVNPATITISGNKSVSATFVQDSRPYFSVTAQATFGGTVLQTPQGQKLAEGTTVTLTATSIDGWIFNGWSGSLIGTEAVLTIPSLSTDISVTASFAPVDKFEYQAESGIVKDAAVEDKNSGFTGDAYVNFSSTAGSSVELSVYVEVAGEKSATITYANGSGTSRQLAIAVNGTEQIATVDFETSSDWTTWLGKRITLLLPQGASTITLTTVDSQDGPNIDKITLDRETLVRIKSPQIKGSRISYNPSRKHLRIPVPSTESLQVSIFSIDGRRVRATSIPVDAATPSVTIMLTGLEHGIYLVRIATHGIVETFHVNIR